MNKFTDFQLLVFEKEQIDCVDVVELLGDYQDDDLPPSLRARVHSHVKNCAYCKEMERTYRLTVKLANELKDPPMPVGVRKRLRAALNDRLGIDLPLRD